MKKDNISSIIIDWLCEYVWEIRDMDKKGENEFCILKSNIIFYFEFFKNVD